MPNPSELQREEEGRSRAASGVMPIGVVEQQKEGLWREVIALVKRVAQQEVTIGELRRRVAELEGKHP